MKFILNSITSPATGQVTLTATVENVPPGDEQKIVNLFQAVQAQTAAGKFTFWDGLIDIAALEAAGG